jgi:hypothetical protein
MKAIGYQALRKLECAEMNRVSGLSLCPALSTESKQELVEDGRTFDSVIWNSIYILAVNTSSYKITA